MKNKESRDQKDYKAKKTYNSVTANQNNIRSRNKNRSLSGQALGKLKKDFYLYYRL